MTGSVSRGSRRKPESGSSHPIRRSRRVACGVCFPQLPDEQFAAQFREALQRWYLQHHRRLPWRATQDPYAILVSEIMLQQTQAATVVPYFRRFLDRFPDLESLAQAPLEEVIGLWQGLGYYKRALALHQAARILVRDHAGEFPREPMVLQRLPGIGRYTAHAVLSQAFDLSLPIIEANSARVYARMFTCAQPLTSSAVQRWLWQVAERLVAPRQPGLFNQAIMELGATICLPRQPRCDACPVAQFCHAWRYQRVTDFPVRGPARTVVQVAEVAIVIRNQDRWLVLQRAPDADRWPSLWEFPHAETFLQESAPQAVQRIAQQLTALQVTPSQPLGHVRFSVTRFRIAMTVWHAWAQKKEITLTSLHHAGRWLKRHQLRCLAWSTPQRRVLAMLDKS
ncbi:MAG: A/G-specific adenine glycosylase [Gemmatales bacterium]|nr:A/G-specific adenine glycosylase [Gemmatales bacterium]MCS7159023.1 A/G-specific adenine glycosylase [Gemmatales bacterium]MDW8174223.1 A/G-specific adenine glycosylase [Gemmatales bacterium]MDW8223460.1 A/G-specific adenine glycosylase [Gemmatales bacterium]